MRWFELDVAQTLIKRQRFGLREGGDGEYRRTERTTRIRIDVSREAA
jgi:hypothetical protein